MTAFAVTDNLNWSVSKRHLFFTGTDGQPVQWTEKVAVVRDDNDRGLGTVSPDYEIVQNDTLLGLIKPLQEEGLIKIENVGYLQHGATVFIQAKIESEFQVVGEDYKSYITFLNGHVGNKSVAVGTSAYRVVCGNTFAMAYADISERLRHTVGVNERVLETKAISDYVNICMSKYSDNIERLANRSCSIGDFHQTLEQSFQKRLKEMKSTQVDKLEDLFRRGRGNEGKSLYDAFNAITDFTSNEARKSAKTRLQFVNFGTGNRVNQRALRSLNALAMA
jgi:phage/plasmid-like protein (TIGR03299 family)